MLNMIPLNWSLMAAPSNWVIVTLMVMIAGLGLSVIVPQEGK